MAPSRFFFCFLHGVIFISFIVGANIPYKFLLPSWSHIFFSWKLFCWGDISCKFDAFLMEPCFVLIDCFLVGAMFLFNFVFSWWAMFSLNLLFFRKICFASIDWILVWAIFTYWFCALLMSSVFLKFLSCWSHVSFEHFTLVMDPWLLEFDRFLFAAISPELYCSLVGATFVLIFWFLMNICSVSIDCFLVMAMLPSTFLLFYGAMFRCNW